MSDDVTWACAFAPATVGNAAVGFDVLGFAIAGPGDRVTAHRVPMTRTADAKVGAITGCALDLPRDPEQNVATVAALSLLRACGADFSVVLDIDKGLPLGSGMGGSAASAVAAVVATNVLLPFPLSRTALLPYALDGEMVASGARHADNVGPCLLGGLILCHSVDPPGLVSLPLPCGLLCVLVHPGFRLDTRQARQILAKNITLTAHVRQSAHLAAVVAAAFLGDVGLLAQHLSDEIVEPQRKQLIPGFDEAKRAAMAGGALGCSIAGAGPSIFAWCVGDETAIRIRDGVTTAFAGAGLRADGLISPLPAAGAVVEESG